MTVAETQIDSRVRLEDEEDRFYRSQIAPDIFTTSYFKTQTTKLQQEGERMKRYGQAIRYVKIISAYYESCYVPSIEEQRILDPYLKSFLAILLLHEDEGPVGKVSVEARKRAFEELRREYGFDDISGCISDTKHIVQFTVFMLKRVKSLIEDARISLPSEMKWDEQLLNMAIQDEEELERMHYDELSGDSPIKDYPSPIWDELDSKS